MLRRRATSIPEGLPAFLAGPATALEKTLMAAGSDDARPGKLMLALADRAGASSSWRSSCSWPRPACRIGAGRVLLIATFAFLVGAGIPMLYFQAKATRMRKKMQDQFPVALDVFVRGLRAGHPIACRARPADRRNARSDRQPVRHRRRRGHLWRRPARRADGDGRPLGPRRHAHVRRQPVGAERDRRQSGRNSGKSEPA